MMVGEMGFDALFSNEDGEVSKTGTEVNQNRNSPPKTNPHSTALHVLYALFIFTISIALINLLIGLAVSDIKVSSSRTFS